jgi:hypothetical protein
VFNPKKNHKLTRPKKKKMHSNMRTKSNSNPSKRSRAQTRKESKLPLSLKKLQWPMRSSNTSRSNGSKNKAGMNLNKLIM